MAFFILSTSKIILMRSCTGLGSSDLVPGVSQLLHRLLILWEEKIRDPIKQPKQSGSGVWAAGKRGQGATSKKGCMFIKRVWAVGAGRCLSLHRGQALPGTQPSQLLLASHAQTRSGGSCEGKPWPKGTLDVFPLFLHHLTPGQL